MAGVRITKTSKAMSYLGYSIYIQTQKAWSHNTCHQNYEDLLPTITVRLSFNIYSLPEGKSAKFV